MTATHYKCPEHPQIRGTRQRDGAAPTCSCARTMVPAPGRPLGRKNRTPRARVDEPINTELNVSARASEVARWRACAKAEGVTFARWVRRCLRRYAAE